jgi:hypothetical protein
MRRMVAALLAGASFLIPVSLSSGSEEPEDCLEPKVSPVVHLEDLFSEKVAVPGEPAGNGRCELFCGVSVLDAEQGIPQCASYSCTFELRLPTGETLKRLISLGPTFDGMTHAHTTGTDCLTWKPSYPAGAYMAQLECENKIAELAFTVEESFVREFSIPQSQWVGVNHCPNQP